MSGLHLLKIGGAITVHSIDDGSTAAVAGLQANDVITHVDGRVVGSMRDLRRSLTARDGDTRTLTVHRGKTSLTVSFVLKRIL